MIWIAFDYNFLKEEIKSFVQTSVEKNLNVVITSYRGYVFGIHFVFII